MNSVKARGSGDSPTIREYIDRRSIVELVERTLRGEVAASTSLLTVLGGAVVIQEPSKQGSGFKLLSPAGYRGLHRVKTTSGRSEIIVKGLEESPVSLGLLELNLESSGLTVVRVTGGSGSRLTGLKIHAARGVSHEVIVIQDPVGENTEVTEIIVEQEDSSSLILTILLKPSSLSYTSITSRLAAGSKARKNIIVNPLPGARVDVEDTSLVSEPESSVESYIRSRLEGGSTTALRGRGVVERSARGSRVVYGIESLLCDESSRVYMQPFLDIHTGSVVEARHYARSYMLTLDRLFYIETRGLNTSEARRLLVKGFLTQGLSDTARRVVEESIFS